MPQQDKPVWFITGCSTGFGRELAKFTLDRGYRVVVTARKTADVADLAAGPLPRPSSAGSTSS